MLFMKKKWLFEGEIIYLGDVCIGIIDYMFVVVDGVMCIVIDLGCSIVVFFLFEKLVLFLIKNE